MKDYKEEKQIGNITVDEVTEEELKLSRKQWDPNTGEPVEDKIDIFLKTTLEINKANLERELESINQMLGEFEK